MALLYLFVCAVTAQTQPCANLFLLNQLPGLMNIISGLIILRHVYMVHVAAFTATVIGALTNKSRSNKNKFDYIHKLMPLGVSLCINNSHHHQREAFLQSAPSSSP